MWESVFVREPHLNLNLKLKGRVSHFSGVRAVPLRQVRQLSFLVAVHMSYSLNSLKGLIQGTAIGVTTEDASPLTLRQRARLTSTRTIANWQVGGS